MKSIKMLLAAVVLLGSVVTVYASGAEGKKTQRLKEKMMTEIYDEVDDLDIDNFRLNDEVVDIYFMVDENGKVVVKNIEGDNYIVSTYVGKMLEDKYVEVTEELQNVEHHIKVRYLVL